MSKNYAWKAAVQDTGLGGQRGAGFGDFIKKVGNVASKINQFAKDNKLASKALGVLDSVGLKDKVASTGIGNLALQGLEKAKSLGYGRRRRRVRRTVGGSKSKDMGRRKRVKGGTSGPNPRGGRRRVRRAGCRAVKF